MPEISLKKVRKEGNKLAAPAEVPKEMYPGFNIYEDVPAGLMTFAIGKELTAKIRVSKKEIHEGKDSRESIGFDVLSVSSGEKKEGEKQ